MGGKKVNEPYILCKISGFKREFLRNYSVYRAQLSEITEIIMLFQYSEVIFY